MDYGIQIALIGILSGIMATLIVGAVLIAVGIRHIKTTLKERNDFIRRTNRPYLVCQKVGKHLYFKNLGNMLGKIDSVRASDGTDFTQLNDQVLASGQSFSYSTEENTQLTIDINYHGQIESYSEKFEIK